MVCVTGDDGTVRLRRLGDSYPDWELLRDGRYSRVRAATVGRLSDGAPVIVTGGDDGTVRVWRLADGTPARQPLRGPTNPFHSLAVGERLDGTLIVVTGVDGTERVWRLADGTPMGEPLRGHTGPVNAVAAGRLPDGATVIVTGGDDGTVRVWRLADTTLLLALPYLPEQVSAVAVRGNLIVTAAGTDIAVHQLAPHHLPSR